MKISSVSKKVLASALSAAMVVAFAPTVAFGGTAVVAKNSYISAANGQTVEVEYYDAALAFQKASAPEKIVDSNDKALYNADKATVALADDVTVEAEIEDDATATALTIDLNGKKLTSKGALSHTWAFTTVGDGTIAQSGAAVSEFANVTVGTEDVASNVTFDGGTYLALEVEDGSSIVLNSGIFAGSTTNSAVLTDALNAAKNAGATIQVADVKDMTGATAWNGTAVANGKFYQVSKTVATIGEASYSTLEAAVAAANADETVVLNADIKDAGDCTASKNITVDLNGHAIDRGTLASGVNTITLKGEGKLLGVATTGTIAIDEGANIAVENSAARKGEKTPTKSDLSAALTVAGTLTVAGGTATAAADVTVENGGSFTAAKGEFADVTVEAGGTAAISGGEYASLDVAVNAAATVTGGEFSGAITPAAYVKGVNLTVSKAKYVGAELAENYIAEGSVINEYAGGDKREVGVPVATGKVTVVAKDDTKFSSDVQFASLQGAVYKADAKSTVVLSSDIEETVEVAKELTIDLGGKTVKGGIVAKTGAKVAIDNGTVNGYGKEAVKVEDGEVTIKGGIYTAEVKVNANGTKNTPAKLIDGAKIAGGTFKNATYAVDVTAANITGGTFDKKPTVQKPYVATENADKTWTVALGGINTPNFAAVNGVIEFGTTFQIADKDKALEKAVSDAYSKVLTAAWSANPSATELAGFEFVKDANGKYVTDVEDLTTVAGDAKYALAVTPVDDDDVAIAADKDYTLGAVRKVTIAVKNAAETATIGYLTGIAVDVTYAVNLDTANRTYKVVGADATYDAEKKAYTFTTKTGSQFAVESIANSILDLQDKVDQIETEKATQSIDVDKKSKTVKLAKGKTKTQKAQSFKMGISAETAVTTSIKSGSSKISIKGGKVTLAKGAKKGTYTAKVSIKAAASDEYLAAAKTVTVKFVVKK